MYVIIENVIRDFNKGYKRIYSYMYASVYRETHKEPPYMSHLSESDAIFMCNFLNKKS